MERRSFLKLGFGASLVLAAGGLGLGLQSSLLRTPAVPLSALTQRQYSVLTAIVDRIHPGGEGWPSGSELQVAEKLDKLFASANPGLAKEFGLALLLLENALTGFLFGQRVKPFTRCSPEVQDRILASWQTSSLDFRRTVFKGINGLCTATYWAAPELRKGIGYPGPLPLEVG